MEYLGNLTWIICHTAKPKFGTNPGETILLLLS